MKKTSLITKAGRPLSIILPKKNFKILTKQEPILNLSDITNIQTRLNFSTNQTLKMAATIKKTTKQPKIIEKKLKAKLESNSHKLGTLFVSKELIFKKSKEDVKRTIIFCNNLKYFIDLISKKREYNMNTLIKIGVDGEGGFFQVCLSFDQFSSIEIKSKKQFSDSGVKKLFIIGIVADISESFENVFKV